MTRKNPLRRIKPVGGAASIISGLALLVVLGWAAASASEELARVDGVAITAEEVDWALSAQLTKLHEQIYHLRRQKVEALVAEKLLAKEAAGDLGTDAPRCRGDRQGRTGHRAGDRELLAGE